MDNQHKKIKTYRDLTQDEIDLMNEVKELEAKFAKVCDKINAFPETNKSDLEHGINSIITGCMWTIRAVARPTSPFNEIEIKK